MVEIKDNFVVLAAHQNWFGAYKVDFVGTKPEVIEYLKKMDLDILETILPLDGCWDAIGFTEHHTEFGLKLDSPESECEGIFSASEIEQ
jgi:hypothetical protein